VLLNPPKSGMAILHVAWYDRMYNLMRLAIPSANLHSLRSKWSDFARGPRDHGARYSYPSCLSCGVMTCQCARRRTPYTNKSTMPMRLDDSNIGFLIRSFAVLCAASELNPPTKYSRISGRQSSGLKDSGEHLWCRGLCWLCESRNMISRIYHHNTAKASWNFPCICTDLCGVCQSDVRFWYMLYGDQRRQWGLEIYPDPCIQDDPVIEITSAKIYFSNWFQFV
jgi:hypothetical protein